MTYITKPFFTLVFAIVDIYPLVILLDLIAILLMLFKERHEPRTFILWLMIVIVLPIAGFVLYMLFGCTLYSERKASRKQCADGEYLGSPGSHAIDSEEQIAGTDYAVCGNRTDLYLDSWSYVDDMVRDIGSAGSRVLFEIRSFSHGVLSPVMDAMADAASRGVEVRLLTGVRGFGRTFGIHRVKSAGGIHRTFHNPLYSTFSPKRVNRLFRGIMVIDGRVAYQGVEAVVRIEGPEVSRLERRFCADWRHASDERLDPSPECPPAGDDVIRAVTSGPDSGKGESAASMYQAMAVSAEDTLYLTFEYLVPDENQYNCLRVAACSGVDVRVMIPYKGKHWYQAWNSLSASNQLMLSGVRVYFTYNRSLRNVMVCDDKAVVVGSIVYNDRSMNNDYGISTIVDSRKAASEARLYFETELEGAVECRPEEYSDRSFIDRMKIVFARMMMFIN